MSESFNIPAVRGTGPVRNIEVLGLLFALFALLLVAYFLTGYPLYWEQKMRKAALIWLISCGVLIWALRRWRPQQAPLLFCGAISVYLVLGIGIPPVLSAIFFLVSAHATGYLLLKLIDRNATPGWMESLVMGLVVILALWSKLISSKINSQGLYLALLSLPLMTFLYRGSSRMATGYLESFGEFRSWTRSIPFPLFAVFAAYTGWVACYSFFPTVGPDDNVYHLRMWTELLYQKKYSFDVANEIFSVAPFASDLIHSIVSILAGEDARGALNFVLMLLTLGQMAIVFRKLRQSATDEVLLLLLMVSTPMLAYLLITLQTEMFLTFLCTTAVRLILDCSEGWSGRNVLAVLAIAAIAVATKLTGVILGGFLLAALFVRVQFLARPVPRPMGGLNVVALLVLLGTLAFAAFYPYGAAYLKAGNPVFPYFNGVFKSPFYPPENFLDLRYIKKLSVHSYWDIFLKTSEHYDSRDFVAGFQYMILFPAALLLMWRRAVPRVFWIVLIPVLGFGLTTYYATQYWRYVFPVLPLAGISIAALLTTQNGLVAYCVRGLTLGCICLNIFFFPGINWMFGTPPQNLFSEGGKRDFIARMVPEMAAIERLNQDVPGARVLFVQQPFGATLNGTPLYVEWYAPSRSQRFGEIGSTEDVVQFIKDEKVQFVVWSLSDASPSGSPKSLLREYLSRQAYPLLQKNGTVLYSPTGGELKFREAFSYRRPPEGSETLPAVASTPFVDPMQATKESKIISTLDTAGSIAARYSVSFKCHSAQGSFVARLSWNVGEIYYRLVPCEGNNTEFSESVPIPLGATKGDLNIEVRDVESAQISRLTIEFL